MAELDKSEHLALAFTTAILKRSDFKITMTDNVTIANTAYALYQDTLRAIRDTDSARVKGTKLRRVHHY